MPLFFVKWSWSFGATSSSFILLPLLQWTSMPYLLHIFFTLSLRPSSYETVMWPLLMILLLLLLLFGFGVFIFNFVLFIAQLGYLHCNRTFCIRECSSSRSCWLEQRFFALCSRELMMLYLFDMAWWLSHCTYWLVWLGFLYTVVARLPSLWGVTKVSKKGIDPSALVVSAVNLMFGSKELICWRNSSWCCSSWMTKVSSTYLFHRLGGCVELCLRPVVQNSPWICWPLWDWVDFP